MMGYDLHKKVTAIVRDAGGDLVGRTRLQKVVYLCQLAGFSQDFPFEYRHYGPYSEEMAQAMKIATGLRLVEEEERQADWGARYSIYRVINPDLAGAPAQEDRAAFIAATEQISAIELELAATAAYLYVEENVADPWEETACRKPEKAADGRLDQAKIAYQRLMNLNTPTQLPHIVC